VKFDQKSYSPFWVKNCIKKKMCDTNIISFVKMSCRDFFYIFILHPFSFFWWENLQEKKIVATHSEDIFIFIFIFIFILIPPVIKNNCWDVLFFFIFYFYFFYFIKNNCLDDSRLQKVRKTYFFHRWSNRPKRAKTIT
jgi:hypothetical protein